MWWPRQNAPVAESPSKTSQASANGHGSASQRATRSSWAFAQLGQFIAYKARRVGVPVVHVDPAYTSQTCAECGHIDKANRVRQAQFACRSCGFVDHADRNSSRNIRARARQLWRRGAPSTAPPPPQPRPGAGRKLSITASDAPLCKPGTSVPGR
ncbi:zinc ribbon domain-containing protein [Streptomyces sp. NPDC053750]|uniref:zinc ribbon domain-containing protein n=1 Tax=Streptomyces sp. NPDC053750 TaxID=3365714 RepID=UPI0037D08C38